MNCGDNPRRHCVTGLRAAFGLDNETLRPVNHATLGSVLLLVEGNRSPGPIGEPPDCYCDGAQIKVNTHAIKEFPTLVSGRYAYCGVVTGGKHPPHDGKPATILNPPGLAVAWEANIFLSVKPDVGAFAKGGGKKYMDFFANNLDNMYIYQELTFVSYLYTSERTWKRVEHTVTKEEFQLDEFGASRDMDPHAYAAPHPMYCKVRTDESATLELIWKRPKAGSGKNNRQFHYYGRDKRHQDFGDKKWSPWERGGDVAAGREGYDWEPLNIRGQYAFSYEVTHCGARDVPGQEQRMPLPDPEPGGTPTPPDSGTGTPTLPGWEKFREW